MRFHTVRIKSTEKTSSRSSCLLLVGEGLARLTTDSSEVFTSSEECQASSGKHILAVVWNWRTAEALEVRSGRLAPSAIPAASLSGNGKGKLTDPSVNGSTTG